VYKCAGSTAAGKSGWMRCFDRDTVGLLIMKINGGHKRGKRLDVIA